MSIWFPRRVRRLPLVCSVAAALLTASFSAFSQVVAAYPHTRELPTLALRIEGEPTLPIERLRSELALATGKPVTLGDQGAAGTISVKFETDAAGASLVTIVYQPPLAELTRTDKLPQGQLEGAHHIGLLAQGLIQRDAGITLLRPEPSAPVLDRTLGSCAQSLELARPTATESTREKPEPKPKSGSESKAPPSEESPDDAWRGALGLHWGPLGFGVASGPFPSNIPGVERGALTLNDGGWLVGGAVNVHMPSGNRFRFGMQAYFDQFALDGHDENGVSQTLNTWFIGLAVTPSVRLTPIGSFAEVRAAIGLGLNFASDIHSNAANGLSTFAGESIGYRLGAAFTGTSWLTESLGITLTLGFDHSFLTGPGSTRVPFDEQTGTNVNQGQVSVWLNQPYLRVAAEYRF